MLKKRKTQIFAIVLLLLISITCSPFAAFNANPTPTVIADSPALSDTDTPTPQPTDIPTITPTPTIAHTTHPVNIEISGTIIYDVESKSTAPEQRAPYGDSYDINRFERPFTQNDMTYLPDIDIVTFRMTSDSDWFYIFIELIGDNPNNPDLNINYGVEIDLDHNGHGDYLLWASPTYTTDWSNDNLQIYQDSNQDTGGPSPELSDAPNAGNGYETLIFDGGKADDPDLAWVRIDPEQSNVIQFAFKPALLGDYTSFMWGVCADAGLQDVTMYNYNDHFTYEEAGSPIKGKEYYPIKAIYAVDNTCREAYNFKPTGEEPQLCPLPSQPASKPGEPCVRPASCPDDIEHIWHQDSCYCEIPPIPKPK